MLNDKFVIVTGGASGIGKATAETLLASGWSVLIADRDRSALADVAEVNSGYTNLQTSFLDLGVPASIAALFDGLPTSLRIKGLVNCAAVADSTPFLKTNADRFREVLNVNLVGTFDVCKAAALRMIEANIQGSIVNVTSSSGLRANAGRTTYGTSKAGLEMLSKIMAGELASKGVRVNTVAPGPIETPMVKTLHSKEFREKTLKSIPQRRYGLPTDIASAIAFLLDNDRAGYITGHTLCVDGGAQSAGVFDEN